MRYSTFYENKSNFIETRYPTSQLEELLIPRVGMIVMNDKKYPKKI